MGLEHSKKTRFNLGGGGGAKHNQTHKKTNPDPRRGVKGTGLCEVNELAFMAFAHCFQETHTGVVRNQKEEAMVCLNSQQHPSFLVDNLGGSVTPFKLTPTW